MFNIIVILNFRLFSLLSYLRRFGMRKVVMGWGWGGKSPRLPAFEITPSWLRDLLYFDPLISGFDHVSVSQ